MEERSTVRRYRLGLRVSIKPMSGFSQEPIFGTTLDISSHGFYLRTARMLDEGAKVRFSITLPRQGEETVQGFVSGQAVVTRVERWTMENTDGPVGIAAAIETYKIVQSR